MKIRRPNRNDANELHHFFEQVISDTFQKEGLGHLTDDINNEIKEKDNYLATDLKTNGLEHYFLIGEIDGKIIATAALGKPSYLIADMTPEIKDLKELGTVYVHPDYQGKGYGKLIVDKVLEGQKEFCLDSGYTVAKKIWTHIFGPPYYIAKDFWGEGYDHYIWKISF